MESTLTAIKADIGSIGGHLAPSKEILNRVKETISADRSRSR
jgi:fructose 1,6-bisphosphatase